jgi:apolipoprotein N-acyltransferase
VQANVDLRDKWDPAKRDSTFVPYTAMTTAAAREGARLVIWPETALPMDLPRRPEHLGLVRDLVRESGIFLYAGFVERQVREDGRLDSFNSTFLMADDGVFIDYYRKMHLLPFGERMPFQGIMPWLGRLDFGQAEWTPGPRHTVFEVDGNRFASLICFESIFSRLGRRGVQKGAGFLVNVTNDGWFGDTLLPYQHTWLAVLRASENRVPLIRVANNGLSFYVLPSGRMVESTSLFERERFLVDVTPRPGGSFYTRYGDGTLALLIAVGALFLLVIGRAGARVQTR